MNHDSVSNPMIDVHTYREEKIDLKTRDCTNVTATPHVMVRGGIIYNIFILDCTICAKNKQKIAK